MFAQKVAVAVAIIRTKPENCSAQKHTEQLQARYCWLQSHLDTEYRRAQSKIRKLEGKINQLTVANHCEDNGQSPTTSPPATASVSNSRDAGANEDLMCWENEMVVSDTECSRFLQSIANLQGYASMSQNGSREDLACWAETNLTNLSNILSRGLTPIPQPCMCQAADIVARMFQHFPWLEECEGVMKAVCGLVEVILKRLREPSNYHHNKPHRQKLSMMQMLAILSTHSPCSLAMIILDSLIELWEMFCHSLRQSRQTGTLVPPSTFESSFFVIRALQLTARGWHGAGRRPDPHSLRCLQERIEKSLAHLSEFFPLVSQAGWKTAGLIEQLLEQTLQ